jgi:hypothetical protein
VNLNTKFSETSNNGQFHALAFLLPEERVPGTHWIGAWVGPRAGLDAMAGIEFRLPSP